MKKFFSLMLAVLLLVSAVPFQAFATTTPCTAHNWVQESVRTPATCAAEGARVMKCNNCGEKTVMSIPVDANAHVWGEWQSNVAPTCQAKGEEIRTCTIVASHMERREVGPVAHNRTTVTTDSTCSAEGSKVSTCSYADCTEKVITETIAKKAHNFNAAGACTVCGESDGQSRTDVAFIIDNVGGVSKIYTQTFIDGRTLAVPTAELISNYEFKGWYPAPNGSGNPLTSGMTWVEDTMPDTYYAWYVYNPNNDGMSTITVTARCYIDGVGNAYLDVPVLTQAVADNTNVFDWLTANKNTTILNSVYSKVDTTKYEWKDRYFYNHNGTEVLTEQTVFADGPKAILIKLVEKDNTTRANVQLYLHTSTTAENPFRILDMNGYTSGMNVTRTAAANLVKEYYSYKTIGNLFTDSDWNALQNGENVAGRTSVYIADNGTYKIHVVVTNASSKSSSNADTTNPKTGDYITIAVGTMVMAAAAFITLAEMKKRKMI